MKKHEKVRNSQKGWTCLDKQDSDFDLFQKRKKTTTKMKTTNIQRTRWRSRDVREAERETETR